MTGTRWMGLGGFRSVDTRHETWQGLRENLVAWIRDRGCAATKIQGRIF